MALMDFNEWRKTEFQTLSVSRRYVCGGIIEYLAGGYLVRIGNTERRFALKEQAEKHLWENWSKYEMGHSE